MDTLHLLRPAWLIALLPLAFALYYLYRHKAETSPWQNLVDAHLLSHLLISSKGKKTKGRLIILGLTWLLIILALAGPTWQRVPPLEFKPDVPPLVIILDLSRSMNTRDIHPSRILVAQAKLRQLLEQLPQRPIAMVVYTQQAYSVMPFTEDRKLIIELLSALSPSLMPTQGSRASSGLAFAQNMLESSGANKGDLLLVTDSTDLKALEVAEDLATRGYQLSVFGIGTQQGGFVPDEERGYLLTAKGAVNAALDTNALGALAARGQGLFLQSQRDNSDIEALIRSFNITKVQDAQTESEHGEVWREGGPWLILLTLPLALLMFRQGGVLLLFISFNLLSPSAEAFEWRSLWLNSNQQAYLHLEQNHFSDAIEKFRDPLWRGIAQYRNEEYQAALASFSQLDSFLAHYNRGNTLVQMERYKEALEAYETVLSIAPDFTDAQHNHQLLQQYINSPQDSPAPLQTKPATTSQGEQREGQKIPSLTAEEMLDPPTDEDLKHQSGQAPADLEQVGTAGGGAMLLRGEEHPELDESSTVGEGLTEGETSDRPEDEIAREGRTAGEGQGDTAEKSRAPKHGIEEETTELTDIASDSPEGLQSQADSVASPADAEGKQKDTNDAHSPGVETARHNKLGSSGQGKLEQEQLQALEAWLNTIEDNPAGLLKEKFRRDHQRAPYRSAVEGGW